MEFKGGGVLKRECQQHPRGLAPPGCNCAVTDWHSRPPSLTSTWASSSRLQLPHRRLALSAAAPDLGRGVAPLGRGSALPRLGAELELRRSGSSLGPSQ